MAIQPDVIPACSLDDLFQPSAPAHGAANGVRPRPQSAAPAPARTATLPVIPSAAPGMRPNRLVWRGRLVADPEVRHAPSGVDVCAVRVIQNVLDTHRQPIAQAIEVVTFRERAHDFARLFKKGDLIEVWGELRIRTRRDNQGTWHTGISLHPTEEIALVSRPRPT